MRGEGKRTGFTQFGQQKAKNGSDFSLQLINGCLQKTGSSWRGKLQQP